MQRTTINRELIELIRVGKATKEQILSDLEAPRDASHLRHDTPALHVKVFVFRNAPSGTPIYDLGLELPMYALNDANRVDVLRFGRKPEQDIHLIDKLVSREHGLIIYGGGLPLYCDYGTLQDGVHAGSTNGTFLDGVTRVRDAMITWLPDSTLMLGARLGEHGQHYNIKLTYERHKL